MIRDGEGGNWPTGEHMYFILKQGYTCTLDFTSMRTYRID